MHFFLCIFWFLIGLKKSCSLLSEQLIQFERYTLEDLFFLVINLSLSNVTVMMYDMGVAHFFLCIFWYLIGLKKSCLLMSQQQLTQFERYSLAYSFSLQSCPFAMSHCQDDDTGLRKKGLVMDSFPIQNAFGILLA
jgi:hypothetical protein